jgi:diaminopimelate decarboxylase
VSFEYQDAQLYAENIPLEQLGEKVGTPFYCYSSGMIRERFEAYRESFDPGRSLICYAVKANSNQAVIRLLGEMGAGADVVSAGELQRALQAGIPAEHIVFSGVAKTADEMKYALEQGIFQFNVESEPEVEQLSRVATGMGKQAPIAFRINPDIDAHTHEKITTGRSANKFGVPRRRAADVYAWAASLPGIHVQGIATHIGSQLTQLEPFEQAFHCHAELATELRGQGHEISVLDIGGGLGIDYGDGKPEPPPLAEYAALARKILDPLNCRILVEPGRSLVAESGVLVARIIYVKEGESTRFLIVDAGMNDLLRPSLYDAWHEISAVRVHEGEAAPYDVVGPVCETGDTFARNRLLPPLEAGELIAIRNAGAYGAVMSSLYNTRPLVPEVLVDGSEYAVIRERLDAGAIIALDSATGK